MNNEPIRIAQVLGKMNSGGVESFIMNYYRNIDKEKIQFDFITDKNSTIPQEEEILSMGGKIIRVSPYKNIFKYIIELKTIFKKNKYKVVHSHLNTLSGFPLFAAYLADVPVRISHSHSTASKKELLKSLLKKILRHTSDIFATDCFACSTDAAIFQFGNKKVAKNKIIYLKNAINSHKFSYDEQKRINLRNKLNISENTFVYGHVGRFDSSKNHIFLLKLFYKLKNKNNDSKLILVGDGKERGFITELINKYNLKNDVILVGNVTNVEDYYQVMDFFLFPSLYEGLGMSLIEAQCSGLQCIASNYVPLEAKISDLVEYRSVDKVDNWLNFEIRKIDRKKYENCVLENGYNIETESKKIEKIYLDMYRR